MIRNPKNVLMPSSILEITRMGAMLFGMGSCCQGEETKIL